MRITGNPSDAALLRYVSRINSVEQLRSDYETVFEIPFNSIRKWHLMIVRKADAKADQDKNIKFTLIMKGAPEVLITKCAFYANEDGQAQITEDYEFNFQDAYLHFGKAGIST